MVDLDRGERGDVHAPARHHRREHGASGDRGGPRRELLRPAVGDRRLHADARRVRAHRRLARRPARAQARLRLGHRDLHALVAARRPGHRSHLPEPRARGPGHRRRDPVRGVARAARAGVRRRQGARQRARGLRRHHRRGGCDWPARGRRHRRQPRLGVGLLPQRADRHRRVGRDLSQAARVAGSQRDPDRLGGRLDLQRLALPARARPRARQRGGMGEHADRLAVRRARLRCWWPSS